MCSVAQSCPTLCNPPWTIAHQAPLSVAFSIEKELKEVQEKLHNARLFKEKLGEIEPERDVLTDEDKILQLKRVYKKSEIRVIGNEVSPSKAQNDILNDIRM